MSNPKVGLSATDEAIRLAREAQRPLDPVSVAAGLIDKSMRETQSLADLASGRASELSTVDKAMRAASGITDTVSRYAEGGLAAKAIHDALKVQRDPFERALERSGTLADAVRGIRGFRGIDDSMFAGVKTGLDKFETASAALRDELAKSRLDDPVSFADAERHFPPLPPMPRNPILKTNELLDEMVDRLSEQHALIEASAEAQKRETELLGQLVEAFTKSQAESDRATRRAQMQAWIGIGVAIATGVAPLIILLFSGH